jgi:putative hydroxymethylpyrimidine transporter CytX
MNIALDSAARAVPTEPAATLDGDVPRSLGTWDQLAFWANLGISLLGPVTALYLLYPTATGAQLSFVAAFVALVVGTVLGTALVSAVGVPGTDTGAPAMVLLRGLFGTRLSYLPTVLNFLQLIGWAVFELIVIASAADQLLPGHMHWPYVLVGGALSTAMAIRPLGSVRVLRKYVLIAVVVAAAYLFVQLARHPLPSLTAGSWSGFWNATDVMVALSVSWVPLVADYSRHARTVRGGVIGSLVGYSLTQIICVSLGLLAFATVVSTDAADPQRDIFGAFIAVGLGKVAFAVLVARELDQSFANIYSTATSAQNLLQRVDRRVLAVAIGTVATILGLVFDIGQYQNFLLLIGSIFVPLAAVLIIDYFVLGGRGHWDVSDSARSRWVALIPWLIGTSVYQLVAPVPVEHWDALWRRVADGIGWHNPSWASASVASFLAAAIVTLLLAPWMRRSAGRQ